MISSLMNKTQCINSSISFTSNNNNYNCLNKSDVKGNAKGVVKTQSLLNFDNLTSDEISKLLLRKSKFLPASISDYFFVTGLYLNGGKDFNFLDDAYEKLNKKLNDRLNLKSDGELFKENYLPEIKYVQQITQEIDALKNKKNDNYKFEEIISNISKKYLKTPVYRKKFFVY